MSDRPHAPRDFKSALRRADAEQPGLSPEAEKHLRARIEATLDGPPPRPAWLSWPVLVGSLGVAAAAVALVVLSPAAPREVGGFQLADRSADVRVEAGGQLALAPSVVVTDAAGGRVESLEVSRIQADPKGFRVLSGLVRVSVTKRAVGESPYEVVVSSGSIRVLGTAFTIEERGDGGAVTLHEGRIQFTHADGFTETLTPGQRTTWPHVVAPVEPVPVPAPEPVAPHPTPTDIPPPPTPSPAAPPPPATPSPLPAPTEPVPTPAPAPPVATLTAEELRIETLRADAVLTRVSGLRSRGRFDDAVTALDTALADAYAPSTRERLSFEQLSILAFQLHDAARTCDALRRHLATFGPGRYADGLDQVRAEHACAKP